MMKTKLTLFVTVLAAALFGMGCASVETNSDPLKKGLVAYYPFNGNAKDESGNGNDGKAKGATLAEDRNGAAHQSFKFNGTSDYIELGEADSFNFGTNHFTISCWLKPSGNQIGKYIIGKYFSDSPGYGIGTQNDTRTYVFIYDQQQKISAGGGSKTLANGEWHQVVAVWQRPNVLDVYEDGEKSTSINISSVTDSVNNSYYLLVGRVSSGQYFKGSIDDVRIYNRALSAEEVKALYDLEKPKGK